VEVVAATRADPTITDMQRVTQLYLRRLYELWEEIPEDVRRSTLQHPGATRGQASLQPDPSDLPRPPAAAIQGLPVRSAATVLAGMPKTRQRLP
jgi:hypothetical protein